MKSAHYTDGYPISHQKKLPKTGLRMGSKYNPLLYKN